MAVNLIQIRLTTSTHIVVKQHDGKKPLYSGEQDCSGYCCDLTLTLHPASLHCDEGTIYSHAISEQIKEAGNYREIRYLRPVTASRVRYNGREYLNLCSNSYLSLHLHPDVIRAAKESIDEYGAGTCSSRSVSGSIDLYAMLEDEVASFKRYEKALIFSNGYLANIGIIATLTDEHDVIFSDELNHSSIIDSTRLSGARKVIYRHLDVEDLDQENKTGARQVQRNLSSLRRSSAWTGMWRLSGSSMR